MSHHLRGYGHPGILVALCASTLCYKNFISGLRSCENQPPLGWLIVELLQSLGDEIQVVLLETLFFVAYSILLGC